MKCLLFILCSFTFSIHAHVCSYEVFTPKFLFKRMVYEVERAGLITLQSHETSPAGKITSATVVNPEGTLGEFRLVHSLKTRKSELRVSDNSGYTYLKVTESPEGVNRTELSIYNSDRETSPDLLILKFPVGGVHHYIGLNNEGITNFYIEFRNWWRRSFEAVEMATPIAFPPKNIVEEFEFRCDLDLELRLYKALFRPIVEGEHYKIIGIAPSHGVYQRLVRTAQAVFGIETRFDVTIDYRLKVSSWQEAPHCRETAHRHPLFRPEEIE